MVDGARVARRDRRGRLPVPVVVVTRSRHPNVNTTRQESPDAIDAALGDVPVTQPTLAPLARAGVTRR